jgi:hypothetical protein
MDFTLCPSVDSRQSGFVHLWYLVREQSDQGIVFVVWSWCPQAGQEALNLGV